MPKSPFTRSQDDLIESFYPEFVKKMDEGSSGGELTKWKQGKASDILESDIFKDLDCTKFSRKNWFEMIVRKFTNYRNQVYLKNNPATASSAISSMKKNPIMKFSSVLSGRQLFAQKNKTSFTADTEQRMKDTNNQNFGAVYQAILCHKWDSLTDEERKEWNDRAEAEAGDIQRNQEHFPETIGLALQDLCQGGLVGDAEMVLFYGFRDSEGHDLVSGSIHAHCQHNKKQFGSDESTLQSDYEQHWWEFLDSVIPQRVQDSSSVPRNSTGHPIFPQINLESTPTADIRVLIVDYFEQCWVTKAARGIDDKVLLMPWEKIATTPDQFFDTESFPIKLDHPQNLSTAGVHELATALFKISAIDNPNPFRFRDAKEDSTISSPPPERDPSAPPEEHKPQSFGPKAPPPPPKSPSQSVQDEQDEASEKRKLNDE
ncbi:hypothetical protein R3P38DRAFT_2556888 [Favolaschia claudopus]|uniref:Uncharacterized protein n=1 Tax=Favolaschia claudopus TaxID=2862362 RepID=A0AAW0A8U8_9AGAR